jgi:prepilin-type N-terminal cleavage/methylation domain-containing protein
MRRFTQAFTLIELLIVVAIIAILAAIAVPNFLEAQVRSKVARVNNDLRTLTIGIEAYAVDNNSYPMNMLVDQVTPSQQDPWIPGHPLYSGTPSPGSGYNEFFLSHKPGLSITTPVAYLSSFPVEPFFIPGMPVYGPMDGGPAATGTNPVRKEYLYTNSKTGAAGVNTVNAFQMAYGAWRLWSGGPAQTRREVLLREGAPQTSMIAYDPTNGSISRGAIWRTQRNPDGGRPFVPGWVE